MRPVKMERVKYGYARVSTDDQNPALQPAALEKAGGAKPFSKPEETETRRHPHSVKPHRLGCSPRDGTLEDLPQGPAGTPSPKNPGA